MKDAKGHGSEKRGGGSAAGDIAARLGLRPEIASAVTRSAHNAGINRIGLNNPAYTEAQKVRGWTVPRTPLNADYSTSGSLLRQRMADISKEGHKAAGDQHIISAMSMNAQHRDLVDKAMSKLGMESPGPLISGIVSDKFSEGDKTRLRNLAVGASNHTSAAFAHYAASGMRLPTARTRYQGLKG